jgi:hypothetical protein
MLTYRTTLRFQRYRVVLVGKSTAPRCKCPGGDMSSRITTRPALLMCAAGVLVTGLSSCSSSSSAPSPPVYASSGYSPSSSSYPTASAGGSTSALATDCSQSDTELSVPSGINPRTVSAKTDSTRTSLLIDNTGYQTLLVVPDGGTSLQRIDANQTDTVDQTALNALNRSKVLAADPNVPAGTLLDSRFIVPPAFSICGTVSDIGEYPQVNIILDKEAGIAWAVSHAIAQSLENRLEDKAFSDSESVQELAECADSASTFASEHQDYSDDELYVEAIATGSTCYQSYNKILTDSEGSERAEEDNPEVKDDVLDFLKRLPELLNAEHFVLNLVHR